MPKLILSWQCLILQVNNLVFKVFYNQKEGIDGSRRGPMRKGAIFSAKPVRSDISMATPEIVAGPVAASKRPLGTFERKRLRGVFQQPHWRGHRRSDQNTVFHWLLQHESQKIRRRLALGAGMLQEFFQQQGKDHQGRGA